MRRLLSQAGFTMIELLVVIAVLGVLAAAVLSAINPIEQINKGRDTGHRSDAEQLLSGVDRYFALHELYPWSDPQYNGNVTSAGLVGDELPGVQTAGGTNCPGTAVNGVDFCIIPSAAAETNPGALTTCVGSLKSMWLCALTETAEIKPAFADRLRAASIGNSLYAYKAAGDTESLHVCFLPQSNGFKKEAFDACTSDCRAGATLNAGVCPGTCNGTTYANATTNKEMICL